MKHLLSIEQLTGKEIERLLESAAYLKRQRGREGQPLAGQTWALNPTCQNNFLSYI